MAEHHSWRFFPFWPLPSLEVLEQNNWRQWGMTPASTVIKPKRLNWEWHLALTSADVWKFSLQDLPQEAKRFDRLDRSYVKMMKRAFDTKNVLQVALPTASASDLPNFFLIQAFIFSVLPWRWGAKERCIEAHSRRAGDLFQISRRILGSKATHLPAVLLCHRHCPFVHAQPSQWPRERSTSFAVGLLKHPQLQFAWLNG